MWGGEIASLLSVARYDWVKEKRPDITAGAFEVVLINLYRYLARSIFLVAVNSAVSSR